MNNRRTGVCRYGWYFLLFSLLTGFLVGCEMVPPTPPAGSTTGTPGSTSTSTTTANRPTFNWNIFNPQPVTPPNTGTPGSTQQIHGLDGGTMAAPSSAAAIQQQYGIAVRGTTGTTISNVQLTAGEFSQDEINKINTTLSRLPASFRSATTAIIRAGAVICNGQNYGGYSPSGSSQTYVANGDQGTLVHEMTHAWMQRNSTLRTQWANQFSPSTSPTQYGKQNYREDMCESVRLYFTDGQGFLALDPARYEFIRRYIMEGRTF